MKKNLLLTIIIFICVHLSAQNKKGNLLVGVNFGGAGFGFGKSESSYSLSPNVNKTEYNSFNLYVNPNIGVYINDKTVVGGSINLQPYSSKSDYSNSSNSNTATSKTSYFSFGIGPYARFYLGDNKGKGMPFIQPMAGIYFYPGYKTTYTSASSSYETKYENYTPWRLGVEFGYEHFLNSVIGLQYALGYSYSTYNYEYTVKYSSGPGTNYSGKNESSSSDISFNIGLAIHLASLKKK